MKTVIKIIVALALIISNLPFVKEIFGINEDYYSYSNLSGTLTFQEIFWQGRVMRKSNVINTRNRDWTRFQQLNPKNANDTIIYRHFKINPLKFWRWYEYAFDWRYKMPYVNWEDVVKVRGYRTLTGRNWNSSFQEF
jgi:hypothetical protein